MIKMETYCILDCGNHPGYTVDAQPKTVIIIGTVSLDPSNETYLSCRNKCSQKWPNFQFYRQSSTNLVSCECCRLNDETEVVRIKRQEGFTFGYADSCGKKAQTDQMIYYILLKVSYAREAYFYEK